MQRRIRKIANFFAFNLLFFALYLNFIHKDKSVISTAPTAQQRSAAFSGTATAENTVTVKKETAPALQTAPAPVKSADNGVALRLSIN